MTSRSTEPRGSPLTPTPFATGTPLPPIPGLAFRHFAGPVDYGPMNDVANASRLADGDKFLTTAEGLAAFYENLSNSDRERDLLIVELDGEMVGYARGEWAEGGGVRVLQAACFLVPAARRRGIGRSMLAAMEERLREIERALPPSPTSYFQAECDDAAVGTVALLTSSGYEPVRCWYQMVRPNLDDQPDAPLPEGLEIREVRPEHMRAIWEAEQEAVIDHWGYTDPTEAVYQQFLTDTMTDTSLWRIAWDGDQVAGQVRSFINYEANERLGLKRGQVEYITVRRPWRRRGLARALIAASFPLLRARGMTEGELGVDTENPSGALHLYESVGFRPVGRGASYRKPLADGGST
jgi:ribosomal protein S18 acetylase RimI-like enzyme